VSAGAGSDDAALAHFVEKWLAREPEMRFAEPFFPPAERLHARAWGALLHELREALFELAEPGVARAKTAWWSEELLRLSAGEARHPITLRLPASAPWPTLARALLALPNDAGRSADTREALAALRPAAEAAAAVESAIFAAAATDEMPASLATHWLLGRVPRGLADDDLARLPMHLLARHGLTAAQLQQAPAALLSDWAGELLRALPARGQGAFLRRARLRFDAARLCLMAGGAGSARQQPAQLATLWRAWRTARGS